MTALLTADQVRRRYLFLHGLRWLPVGLLIPVMVLLMQERGLTLAQIGLVTAAQGIVVLLLELPTGGLADALGRRPVLLTSAVINLVSLALFAVADSFALFVVVWLLQGVHRALDSGPLDSWYVDATLAADPDAAYEKGLGLGGTVLGVTISAGALLGGGLVALGPVGPVSALTTPVLLAVVVQLAALVALGTLLAEPRAARDRGALRASVAAAPGLVGQAFGLLRRSRVLLALVAVELFWGFGMVTFEILPPARLAEVTGDADRAAALLGPAGSVAWLASAAGAALTPLLIRWWGAAPSAAVLRVVQGATVVGMGLLAGPVGVLLAYLACYTVHGASNPLHTGLLHRQVDGPYRTSVLSLNSMVAMPAGALGGIVLTALADAAGVRTAMLVGAVVLAVAAPLYLPAWRAARRAPNTPNTPAAPTGTVAPAPTADSATPAAPAPTADSATPAGPAPTAGPLRAADSAVPAGTEAG
ncbi:Predicted arabinose efflux permease, MFS family [Micromonospora pallida]|uniref:Predicted arabinose efflux permease, MFS family n=1 Tax=Micromonospora pallida TaxID=145854 RepID=A0A1C6SMN8_9ACTN|nr:MFS transporter [Micromonospora pallida]SCL30653.1 Predicted arabinose efflux permease, MFS family [Micromonospora pallida]